MVSTHEKNAPSEYNSWSANKIVVSKISKTSDIDVVISALNNASLFNHVKQLSAVFVFISLLSINLLCVVTYKYYKPTLLPPPWFIVSKFNSRFTASGWKISNLLYKSKLLFQH